ncbi:MAG: type toxin-antitoxin system ParD family antitoxin [Rubritepida sp.]|nr:type toxin-antitoxin system ParD family antitoxin [Rubritepida sp.]
MANVSVGEHWEQFAAKMVKSGRYTTVSEVYRDGLRLVEEREAKLAELRDKLEASIARGGQNSETDVMRALDAKAAELGKAHA